MTRSGSQSSWGGVVNQGLWKGQPMQCFQIRNFILKTGLLVPFKNQKVLAITYWKEGRHTSVPSTLNPAPSIQHPAPSTQCPAPRTQYPVPSTLNPAPSIQHPVLSTQYPEPRTQHPAPSTQYLALDSHEVHLAQQVLPHYSPETCL